MRSASSHDAFTVVELLVVLFIAAILLALLLAGIVRMRNLANRSQSENNLRQLVLAIQQFATNNGGRFPPVGTEGVVQLAPGIAGPGKQSPSLFVEILPYIERRPLKKNRTVPIFVSPADPTLSGLLASNAGVSSYAANAAAFKESPQVSTFQDGNSNTIAFAEHYAYKCHGFFSFAYWEDVLLESKPHGVIRRASFADTSDVVPITQGGFPLSLPSQTPVVPVATFQLMPSVAECNPFVPQTPHSSGMLVAMADGSVRQVSPGITPSTFWSAVTPRGGEVLGSDW